MKIADEIRKALNSFETSELIRLLEALEYQRLCVSGCFGVEATAEAYDIVESDDFDEDKDEWIDLIEIEVEVSEQTENSTTSIKSCYKVSRDILSDHKMSIRDKLAEVQEV